MGLLLEFRDYNKRTKDGLYTQGSLIRRIKQTVSRYNTSNDSNNEVTHSIVCSFTINGIIETYNEAGLNGYDNIIRQMVDLENYNRRTVYDTTNNRRI